MAPLPRIRLKYSPPFTKVGVDYKSKFQVKMIIRARTSHPCYMVIFTCLITRAVHTELVLSNEAENFLLALHRMMSIRGTPSHLYSDNELYFEKAHKELYETIAINNEIIKIKCYFCKLKAKEVVCLASGQKKMVDLSWSLCSLLEHFFNRPSSCQGCCFFAFCSHC